MHMKMKPTIRRHICHTLKKASILLLSLIVFSGIAFARPSCCTMFFAHCIPTSPSSDDADYHCHSLPKDCSEVVGINPCAEKALMDGETDESCCDTTPCEPSPKKDPFDRSISKNEYTLGDTIPIFYRSDDNVGIFANKDVSLSIQTTQIYILIQSLIC